MPQTLIPESIFRPLFGYRLESLYHPLMPLAYLADPKARKAHFIPITNLLLQLFSNWLVEEYKLSNQEAGQYLLLLCDLKNKTGEFDNEVIWYAGETMSTIEWWQLWEPKVPGFAKLCKIVLTILPTTGEAERNWSSYGFIQSLRRNRLTLDRAEKLVFLHYNLKGKRRSEASVFTEPTMQALQESEEDFEDSDGGPEINNADLEDNNETQSKDGRYMPHYIIAERNEHSSEDFENFESTLVLPEPDPE